MIQPVVVAGLAAVAGAVLAITARDGRLVAIGVFVAMVAAPLASSPAPTGLVVAFRILGSLLAAYLLWAATRVRSVRSEGSDIGPLAEISAAAAAFSVGWFIAPVTPLAGPLAAQASGTALVALAIVPLAGKDVLRAGVGAVVMVIGGSLLVEAWVGPASSLGQIVLTALLVGIVGATGVLISPRDAPAAWRVATAQPDLEVARSTEPAITGSADLAPDQPVGAPFAEAPAGPTAGRRVVGVSKPAASQPVSPTAGSLPAAGPVPARGRAPAGPMATRKVPKKVARRAAAEKLNEPAASTPAAGRPRSVSIRTSPTRPLRGDQARVRPPADDVALPDEAAEPPVPQPQPGSIVNRVRRLRPREPRQ